MELAADRKVNQRLIDAEVRAELSPKKYKAAHEAYLKKVLSGGQAKRPFVYEAPPPEIKTQPASEGQEGESASESDTPASVKPAAGKRNSKRTAASKTKTGKAAQSSN